jgi:hypothetical protein
MRKSGSISKVPAIALALLLLTGCLGPRPAGEESRRPPTTTEADPRGFDPLELPRDREVVPEKYPRQGTLEGRGELVSTEGKDVDSVYRSIANLAPGVDTLNNQTFRVQLFTSKLYGEARRAVTVAEEIFDQPVFLDYEVPYYKVRVGGFADRDAAEDYQDKAREAGYPGAWVVVVNLDISQPAPLYDESNLEGLEGEYSPEEEAPRTDE